MPFVAVTRNGQLLAEVKQALAVIAKNDFTLASGHVLAEEALLVFREAKAAGVQRLIATHAAHLTGKMITRTFQARASSRRDRRS